MLYLATTFSFWIGTGYWTCGCFHCRPFSRQIPWLVSFFTILNCHALTIWSNCDCDRLFWMYWCMIIFWFSSFAQLLGHAFYGYWSWKVNENAETVRGQGPVSGLPDVERTQSEYWNNASLHTLANIFFYESLCVYSISMLLESFIGWERLF